MTELTSNEPKKLPLIPLRDVVVYPQMVLPLFVGREKSVEAIQVAAKNEGKQVLLVAQHKAEYDDPSTDQLYKVGTLASILQLLTLPDGTLKILVEGRQRVVLSDIDEENYLTATYQPQIVDSAKALDHEHAVKQLQGDLNEYVESNKRLPKEVLAALNDISDAGVLADSIAMHLPFDLDVKQEILECLDVQERVNLINTLIGAELDAQDVEKSVRSRVKKQMEKSQREYYLNEQMKAIQKELGEIDAEEGEFVQLETRIRDAKMPEKAEAKATAELNKLKMMSPMSAEASVIRNYLDWMTSIPWSKKSKLKHDLGRAEKILDNDHYGLEEVKERILEFLAVQKRVRKLKGPILCLVGPPGVGKTSLGESIARATNREFVRMALGGVRDESEIRGHRRTYIGSMPGKIVQKLAKVGTKNPLFLLDEIDKMGMDFRGDPASALLEVLDPEQNASFNDHYLEMDFDLSEIMFVCTANSMNIPGPLLDRMEVIRLPGYTEDEKCAIAQKYLVPKQFKANGIKSNEIELNESVIRKIVREYTREAGVRGLEREVSKVSRKVVMKNARSNTKKVETFVVTDANLTDLLGVEKFAYGIAEKENRVGAVNGLAWTQVGGELLQIEVSSVPGAGKTIKTGSLGDVMQESMQAAVTVVRGRSESLGIDPEFHAKRDIHIHIPEGATPKDGPSAGIGITTALVSELSGIAVRSDVAMTGEITLRGEVLPIGGLKEKLLAAHRAGLKTIIIPQANAKNLVDVPANILEGLSVHPVRWIDEVLDLALERTPKPVKSQKSEPVEREPNPEVTPDPQPRPH